KKIKKIKKKRKQRLMGCVQSKTKRIPNSGICLKKNKIIFGLHLHFLVVIHERQCPSCTSVKVLLYYKILHSHQPSFTDTLLEKRDK
ncbi:hypothetical protein VIGAN_09097500, partial [Vigna angularis var. angularis]